MISKKNIIIKQERYHFDIFLVMAHIFIECEEFETEPVEFNCISLSFSNSFGIYFNLTKSIKLPVEVFVAVAHL